MARTTGTASQVDMTPTDNPLETAKCTSGPYQEMDA